MAIRVAHIGTGNVGRIALNHLISDPRFDLTGVWVSSDAKVGKDAGELAGLDVSTGHRRDQRSGRPAGHRTRLRRVLRDG